MKQAQFLKIRIRKFKLNENNYIDLISGVVSEISNKIEEHNSTKLRGQKLKLMPVIYDATTNAYRHGNKSDPKKTTTIAYKISKDRLDLMIEDEGGRIESEAISFFLKYQAEINLGFNKSYYSFTGKKPKKGHAGLGTFLIHSQAEKVEYYKNIKGGLGMHIVL